MQNSRLNNSAEEHSGYSAQDTKGPNCRRSHWRPTNLNLERFTLEEGSNMTQSHTYSVSSSHQQDVENNSRRTASGSSKATLAAVNPNQPVTQGGGSFINCGWVATAVVGLMCLTFILCIYLIPSEGIFPVSVNLRGDSTGEVIRKKGGMVVYPGQVSAEAISRNTTDSYVISTNNSHFHHAANTLHNITSEYNKTACNEELAKPYVNCYFQNPNPNSPCIFERSWFGRSCTMDNNFGYREVDGAISPCFLIRIVDTEDWYPENWLPKEIGDTYKMEYGSSFIGLSCHPQSYEDRDKVRFTQSPAKGFPQDFFPISDFQADRYIYPAVMVQMHGLKVEQSIAVTCTLRARNAYHLQDSGSITVTFQAHK